VRGSYSGVLSFALFPNTDFLTGRIAAAAAISASGYLTLHNTDAYRFRIKRRYALAPVLKLPDVPPAFHLDHRHPDLRHRVSIERKN
jgi:hypothetical protein